MNQTFICPTCKMDLNRVKKGYRCQNCKFFYPIQDGIFCFKGKEEKAGGYDYELCAGLFKVEGKHFWHNGRREIIHEMLKKYAKKDLGKLRMLEIGCGNGNVMEYLSKKGVMIEGADASFDGLKFCQKIMNVPLYQVNALNLPFCKSSYDIIGLFDVIEHVDDDGLLLREVSRVCKEGGMVLITVPAYKSLWSYFDVFSGHKRRYEKKDLEQELKRAGFLIEKSSFYVFFLFPLFWIIRKLNNSRQGDSFKVEKLKEMKIIPVINTFFLLLLRLEKMILKNLDFPFGSSLLVMARKVKN